MMEGSWRWAVSLAAGMGVGFWVRRRSLPGAEYSFTNRSVVITGGSRGLGLVLARKLAREGARVTLLARDPDELLRAENELSGFGGQAVGIPCDITQPQQVEQAIHRVMEIYGRVDVLINDAGIIQVGPLDHMTVQDFEDAMAVHVYGPLYLTRAVLPHMRTARGRADREYHLDCRKNCGAALAALHGQQVCPGRLV